MESDFLLPDLHDPENAEFWAGCSRGELLVQACADCGRPRMPPRPMCPHCRSTSVRWERTSGHGTVWSFIVCHPPLLPAYAEYAPYNAVIVELDETPGIRFVGNVVADAGSPINSVDPATIEIGDPVDVVFSSVDDVFLPRWVRRPDA